jgi:hypothetical protein
MHVTSHASTCSVSGRFFNSSGAVSRGKLATFINAHMRTLAETGFVDLVQHPGVSVIPFAVYRSIPRAAGAIAAR